MSHRSASTTIRCGRHRHRLAAHKSIGDLVGGNSALLRSADLILGPTVNRNAAPPRTAQHSTPARAECPHRQLRDTAESVGSRAAAFELGLQPDQFFWVFVGTVLSAGAPWMAQASLIR